MANIASLFFMPIFLTTIGLFFVFESSSVSAFRLYGDSFYFFKLQLVWFILGVGVMIFFSFFDYRKLYYLSFPALMITIVLLIAVLIPGVGRNVLGARRWIGFGPITIQPSEIAKFSSILYLCSWFLHKEKHRFGSFLLLLGFIITLVMIQPDMGTAIIIFGLFVTIYYISGQSLVHLTFLVPLSAAGFLVLAHKSPYRLKRLMAFLDPHSNTQGISYHINQILISLSSGGLLGRGFAESRQKYQFLPEAHTDSIFAIIGEEFGFLGSFFVIILFIFLLHNIYLVAQNSKDKFGKFLAGAIFALFALQIVINLGGMTALIPLTGVPLPFISYGGSSLLIFFSLMGILINIAICPH
jgi:cell division protein FtsW